MLAILPSKVKISNLPPIKHALVEFVELRFSEGCCTGEGLGTSFWPIFVKTAIVCVASFANAKVVREGSLSTR